MAQPHHPEVGSEHIQNISKIQRIGNGAEDIRSSSWSRTHLAPLAQIIIFAPFR
jgi:hypothetical protein